MTKSFLQKVTFFHYLSIPACYLEKLMVIFVRWFSYISLDRFGFYLPSLRMYLQWVFFETPYKILIINGIYEV